MPNYKWITLISGDESQERPVLAFIAPANGFYGLAGQQLIRDRVQLLTRLGFAVKIPVFSLDQTALPEKINFDIAKQKSALEQMQLMIEPNVASRNEVEFPASAPNANSPQVGAEIIIDCIKNGWNMMPLLGGVSFQDKLPYIREYFAAHPEEKNPAVKIFGYSNLTFANSLVLDGICSYLPTQFINNFSKIEEIKAKRLERALSAGEVEWLGFLESQAKKLMAALCNPASVSAGERRVLFYPPNIAANLEGTAMHYPLNAGVFTEIELDPKVFIPNPKEKWSFAIEWMMQEGDPAAAQKAFKLLDRFLESHRANPPQFIELGVLGTRFDGMNGIWDLIYDGDGILEVSDSNVDIILFRESTKQGFIKSLNNFLDGYKSCSAEDKELHGALPSFLQNKLDHNLNKISEIDETISREEIKDILKWQNEIRERIVGKVCEVAKKHNLPLVFNPNYGHVANMSPDVSGPCEYRFEGVSLNLRRLEDRSATISETAADKEKPKPFFSSPTSEKDGKLKSLTGASELS